jgi:plasmid segregation protein ParM
MGSDVATGMFPSLAPLAASRLLAVHGESVLATRRVITITVDGVEYEVGPDVSITAAYGNTGRTLSEDFTLSGSYAALLGGAIHLAGVTRIERLVLGLPVHNMRKYAAELKERFTGEIDFGHGAIHIERVQVIPQPLGSLVFASGNRRDSFGKDSAHLIVDVGYFTTDWVYANGFTMDDKRSGGMPGGASQICQRIAGLIARDQGEAVEDIERIDKALRERKPLFFYGSDIDLDPYLEQSQPLIMATVMEIQNRVGRLSDARSIILSGGGAALYAPAVLKAFPRVRVEVMDMPCLSNARGFLVIGEAAAARERATTKP